MGTPAFQLHQFQGTFILAQNRAMATLLDEELNKLDNSTVGLHVKEFQRANQGEKVNLHTEKEGYPELRTYKFGYAILFHFNYNVARATWEALETLGEEELPPAVHAFKVKLDKRLQALERDSSEEDVQDAA